MPDLKSFASDNYSGVCPEAIHYFNLANNGHDFAYGEDRWTEDASEKFRELFEDDCEVFFVFNGTAANSLAISSLCQPYHSIICSDVAHVETDECGAPEFFSNGTKLLTGNSFNGKLLPESIEEIVNKRKDIHYPKPRVLSITQSTEVGTTYSIGELCALVELAKKYDLKIHMDGARFANAVAELNVSPAQLTTDLGIDVLCFGGIKNGLAIGEAMVFFDKEAAFEFDYRCKQNGQLSSKMRFMSAPWIGLLENETWIKNARHANDSAAYLAAEIKNIPGVNLMFPREANSVFLNLPDKLNKYLMDKGWHYYTFIGSGGARFMCNWNTQKSDIDALISDIKSGLL